MTNLDNAGIRYHTLITTGVGFTNLCRTNPRANVKLSGKKKRLLKKAVGKALELPGANIEREFVLAP